METNESMQKDQTIWASAERRSKFKSSVMSYLLVNTFLIGVWAIGDKDHFWPMWVLLGWGLGLIIKYFKIYHFGELFSVEKEYQKLKDRS